MSAWNPIGAGENSGVPQPEPFETDDDYAYRLQLMEAMSASLLTNQPSSSSNAVVSGSSNQTQVEYLIQMATKLLDDLQCWNDNKPAPQPQNHLREEGECSRSVSNEVCRVYFKGLVENCGKIAGIGVAICDERDHVLFKTSKPVKGESMNKRLVAATALIEGLTAALDLGLANVVFCCDYYPFYMMVHRGILGCVMESSLISIY